MGGGMGQGTCGVGERGGIVSIDLDIHELFWGWLEYSIRLVSFPLG